MAAPPAAAVMDQQLHLVKLWQPQLPPEISGWAVLGLAALALPLPKQSSPPFTQCLPLELSILFTF